MKRINRTLAQKQKRPTNHKVGKTYQAPMHKEEGIIGELLYINSEYRKLEQITMAVSAIMFFPLTYVAVGLGLSALLYILQLLARIFDISLNMTDLFRIEILEPSLWDNIKQFFGYYPLFTIISTVVMVLGIIILYLVTQKQLKIEEEVQREEAQ